jgi:hypothetical protein
MRVATTDVWQLRDAPDAAAFFFESPLSVDADGAPKAYGPHGLNDTLDNLANAGHPGNWWGLVTTKNGTPVVQNGTAPKQPYAGFYISPTSLYDLLFDEADVRRWADATKIPYIALPPAHLHRTGLKIGDLGLVINATNGKYTFVVFADSKSDNPLKVKLGEFSICATAALDAPTSARNGSMSKGIISLIFPNSGIGQGSIPDAKTITVVGRSFLQHFSNHRDKDSKLPTAFPEYPHFARALDLAGY